MATMIKCPFCGGLVDAAADNCIHCGGPLQKAGAAAKPVQRSASLCPACNAVVSPGDIVCVKCGTNLLTGQKVAEEREKSARPRIASLARIFAFVGGLIVLLIVAAALAALAFYVMRDPVGEARRLARAGNLAEASEMLQKHLERTPGDVNAQFLLGKIFWQGQQYARASEAFESVARQGGAGEREAIVLAVLASERGSLTANRQRLATLLGSMIQQRYAGDEELVKLLALLRGMEGEFRGQREAVQEAIATITDLGAVLPGLAFALDNDLETAGRLLDRALQTSPENAPAVVARAMAYMMQQDEEAALPLLESVGEVAPEVDGLAKLQLGMLYMQRDMAGKALPLLTDAKRLLPEDVRADFFHALCLQENKLLDEAVAAFERIASGENTFSGQAALQMAVALMDQGNLERALAMARRASESGLNTARQATIQGRIHALQNELGQAEQAYRRAVSMKADYPAARLELGLLLINRGAVDPGLQELEQYLALAQEDAQRMRVNEIEVLVNQIRQTR